MSHVVQENGRSDNVWSAPEKLVIAYEPIGNLKPRKTNPRKHPRK